MSQAARWSKSAIVRAGRKCNLEGLTKLTIAAESTKPAAAAKPTVAAKKSYYEIVKANGTLPTKLLLKALHERAFVLLEIARSFLNAWMVGVSNSDL